jgi:hypothetical protein
MSSQLSFEGRLLRLGWGVTGCRVAHKDSNYRFREEDPIIVNLLFIKLRPWRFLDMSCVARVC